MIKDYKTESGSTYRVDFADNRLIRFLKDGILATQTLTWGTFAHYEDDAKYVSDYSEGYPEVGDRLFIHGPGFWWASTPVASITEVSDWDDPVS